MDATQHILAAIKKAGSQKKLGEALGYTQNAIWRAKKEGRVTPEMAAAFHREGFGDRSKLRPDIWPEDTDAVPS